MKNLIEDIKHNTPKSMPGYYYLKTQDLQIPFKKLTIECLTRKVSDLNLFFESILKLIEISVNDISEIARILGVDPGIIREAIIDMVNIDYVYASGGKLGITPKGENALKTKKRIDIRKKYLKDIVVDMITGVVYDADSIKLVEPCRNAVLLEGVVDIDNSFLESHFHDFNNVYQTQLKNNSVFGSNAITSELYKIIGVEHSELYYLENKIFMYKSITSDELIFEFLVDDNDKYKNEFYSQLKNSYRPCQENFFEKNRNLISNVASNPMTIDTELIKQTELAHKFLSTNDVTEELEVNIFTKKRYTLNDREYMSYLYNYKIFKYNLIIISSNHLKNLLSQTLCSQLNILANYIPVFIIYDKNEFNIDKTIKFFFKQPNSKLFIIQSNSIEKNAICFGSKLVIHLFENIVTAFERPVSYWIQLCDFDRESITHITDEFVQKYNLNSYIAKTAENNKTEARKQKSKKRFRRSKISKP